MGLSGRRGGLSVNDKKNSSTPNQIKPTKASSTLGQKTLSTQKPTQSSIYIIKPITHSATTASDRFSNITITEDYLPDTFKTGIRLLVYSAKYEYTKK